MNTLKRASASREVLFAFGIICAILGAIGVLLFFGLRAIETRNQAQQTHALDELALIDDSAQDVGEMQAKVLLQVLESDPVKIKALDQEIFFVNKKNLMELLNYGKYADTVKEKQLYTSMMRSRAAYWQETEKVMELSHANRDAEATRLIDDTQAPTYDAYLQAVDTLIGNVEAEAKQTASATTEFIVKIRIVSNMLIGVAILICIGAGFFFVKVAYQLNKDNELLHNEIQERKRTEESLRVLQSAVEQSNDSIVITDAVLNPPGPQIVFVNPAFTKLTGYTADEALGKTPRILQGPRTDKAVLNRLRATLESGDSFHGETINYRKDGSDFCLEWQIAPVRNGGGKITHYVAIQRDISERKQAEAERNRLVAILESTTDLVAMADPTGRLIYVNRAGRKLTGVGLDEDITKKTIIDFIPDPTTNPILTEGLPTAIRDGIWSGETVILSRDGRKIPVSQVILAHKTSDGTLEFTSTVVRDISERKIFEARMFQSQKMETVGKLAGGVAHEFNSIMTAIIGQSEFLLADLSPSDPLYKSAREIRQASDRAAGLTRQLLAFGRKQLLRLEYLDLNVLLTGMEGTLRHLIGRGTDMRIAAAPGLRAVKADASQIEQVILNIAMNAAEAMPNGGKLTLETANVAFESWNIGRVPDLKMGEYVMFAITDTGAGMTDEVKARIFEPFFSTKDVGQGTGLGLAACYGIIKQSGGHISVYSESGRGATIKVYLPAVESTIEPPAPSHAATSLPRGAETILLVEDDPALREMAATLLTRLGYTVLSAGNGVEALKVAHQPQTGHIDLLFTDLVMPHMSGKELADRVQMLFPHTRILFTSAYTENAMFHQRTLHDGIELLQKPFTPSALANRIRKALDSSPAKPPSADV